MARSESGYDLSALFSAFDTVLSLHFCSSITVPKVQDLCEKATQLMKRRIDRSTLERILAYYPQAYQIVHFGSNSQDFGVCAPSGVTPLRFGALLASRRISFDERLACSKNDSLPRVDLSDIAVAYKNSCQELLPKTDSSHHVDMGSDSSDFGSSCSGISVDLMNQDFPLSKKGATQELKIVREGISPSIRSSKSASNSLGKIRKLALSNDSRKFKLKDTSLPNDISLLERIRRKEKEAKLEANHSFKEDSRSRFLCSKSTAVYDFLFELSQQNISRHKSFIVIPMEKIVSMIKDSISGFMSDLEIRDVIQKISSTLSGKVKVIRAGELHVVKVHVLNREEDILLLKETKNRTG